ncbi:MAG: protoporphyrinogen oxidase, partial [Planctomycetales bacterium]|nr:protoporphyrinogen oxidase [Planctomycetales bacterium]
MSSPHSIARVAVVGGGISGLAAALEIESRASNLEVTLFEGSARLGGVIQTVSQDGYLIERAADNFINSPENPWALQLAERTGYADQLIETNTEHRRAEVLWDDRLHRVPEGFQLMATVRMKEVLDSSLLTWRGKARLGWERYVPPRRDGVDESLAEFATRRVGQEAYERLVQPLVAGIYTADPEKLSVAAALPQYVEMERQWGSLTKGLQQRGRQETAVGTSGARYGMFLTPRQGMSHFIEHLRQQLRRTTIQFETRVDSVAQTANGPWELRLTNSSGTSTQAFDAVILALPLHQAAHVVKQLDADLSEALGKVRYSSAAVICMGVRREQIEHPLDAFGIVIPVAQRKRLLALSFSSVKFPQRAPEGCVLVRAFVGGAGHEDRVEWNDDQMRQVVLEETRSIIGMVGEPHLW